jgi:hypothetical protein
MLTNYQAAMDKLQAIIAKGTDGAAKVIEHVINNQPQDSLAKGGGLTFTQNDNKLVVGWNDREGLKQHSIHRHALGQMATTIDMPMKFVDSLVDQKSEWSRDLLAHNLNTIYHERHAKKQNLIRSVNGEVRGFLSDSYRRLDSRPIIEAFATEVKNKGAVPYAGVVTDTKIAIQAIMPQVFNPFEGEVLAYGISLENSDFGNGALSVRAYLLRIWCDNMAITEESMRQIHLGKRLDESTVYSAKTYELDSRTTVSALRDVMRTQLDARSLEQRVAQVRESAAKGVTADQAKAQLRKLLGKGEAEKAAEAFESNDVLNLPEGNTTWRLSNAISWIANAKDVAPERKLELGRIAGEVLAKAA